MIAGVILALSGGTRSGLQAQTSTPPPCLGVFNFVGSLVKCVVSTTGRYTIGAFGAQGGTGINVGGKGAWVQDDFDLTAGTVLTIMVGGTGTGFRTGAALSAGGAGGSFVFGDNPAELWCTGGSGCPVGYESQGAPWPLLVAGGGGGAGTSFDGEPGGIFNYYNVVPGGGPPCVAQFPPRSSSRLATPDWEQVGDSTCIRGRASAATREPTCRESPAGAEGGGGIMSSGFQLVQYPLFFYGYGGGRIGPDSNALGGDSIFGLVGGFGGGGSGSHSDAQLSGGGGGGGGFTGGTGGGNEFNLGGGGGGGGTYSRGVYGAHYRYQSGFRGGNGQVIIGLAAPVDVTPPYFSCGASGGAWHNVNVTIACTAIDPESGLARAADASFSLTTNVPAGTETGNAATDSRQICNADGACTTAGPIAANRVDRKPPTITIGAPALGATYQLNAIVGASYACGDGGSGIATCQGPVANASALDTSSSGSKTFTVTSTDNVGNVSTRSTTYSVASGGGGGTTSADIGIQLLAPSNVSPGATLTYSMTVTNAGRLTATGVVVSDALPPGTVFASASASQGAVTTPAVGSIGTVTANLGNLANGATATISILVTITAPAGAVLTNTVIATAVTQDLSGGNNSATQKTLVTKK